MKKNPWIPVILVTILILALTSLPKIPAPRRDFSLDKLAHFVVYFLWGYSLSRVWNLKDLLKRKFALCMILSLLLFPAFDELHQFIIPGRNPSLLDWIFDIAGSLIGFSIFAKWKRIREF